MVKRQKTSITQFFRPNQSRILQGSKLKRLLMYKVIVDLEPFSSVEAEGLKSMLEYVMQDQMHRLPSRTTIARLMEKEYKAKVRDLKKFLEANVTYHALTMDGRKDRNSGFPMLAIKLHALSPEFRFITVPLGIIRLSDKSVSSIAAEVKQVYNRSSDALDWSKLVGITADGADEAVVKLLQKPYYHCVAHRLDLQGKNAMVAAGLFTKVEEERKNCFVNRTQYLVNLIKNRYKIAVAAANLRSDPQYQVDGRSLPRLRDLAATRFLGMLQLGISVVKQRKIIEALQRVAAEKPREQPWSSWRQLDDNFWNEWSDVLLLLKPFEGILKRPLRPGISDYVSGVSSTFRLTVISPHHQRRSAAIYSWTPS